MKDSQITKILEAVLLLMGEETLLTIEANYGIEKSYSLRGAKILKTLRQEEIENE